MKKNKFIKAFRAKTKICSEMLNIRKKNLKETENAEIIKLLLKHDILQNRLEICDKYFKL